MSKKLICFITLFSFSFTASGPHCLYALRPPSDRRIIKDIIENAKDIEQVCQKIKLIQQYVKNYLLTEEQAAGTIGLFKDTQVMDDPAKQTLLYYLLRQGYRPYVEGDKIFFDSKEIDREEVSIDTKKGLIARNRVIEGVRMITKFKIFADLDENLARRKKKFSDPMLKVLEKLLLYAVGPAIVSDNEWSNVEFRLRPEAGFLQSLRQLWKEIYADGAANLYNGNGEKDKDYAEEIRAIISDEEANAIKGKMFDRFIKSWSPFSIKLFEYLRKNLNNLPEVEGKKKDLDGIIKIIGELGITDIQLARFVELLDIKLKETKQNKVGLVEYLIAVANLIGEERAKEIDSIQKLLRDQKAKEEEHFTFYQVLDVIEVIRVLNSEEDLAPADKRVYQELKDKKNLNEKEKNILQNLETIRLKKDLDSVEKKSILDSFQTEKPETLEFKLRENVQIALKPIRTVCIRNALTNFFAGKLKDLQDKGESKDHYLYQGGQTTINIKRQGVAKATPIARAIKLGLPSIYSGDEVRLSCSLTEARAGTDTSVARLLLNEDYRKLLAVCATSPRKPADVGQLDNFYWTRELALTQDAQSGPTANVIIYEKILGIMEDSIGKLLADKNYHPGPALAVFKDEIRRQPAEELAKEKVQFNQKLSELVDDCCTVSEWKLDNDQVKKVQGKFAALLSAAALANKKEKFAEEGKSAVKVELTAAEVGLIQSTAEHTMKMLIALFKIPQAHYVQDKDLQVGLLKICLSPERNSVEENLAQMRELYEKKLNEDQEPRFLIAEVLIHDYDKFSEVYLQRKGGHEKLSREMIDIHELLDKIKNLSPRGLNEKQQKNILKLAVKNHVLLGNIFGGEWSFLKLLEFLEDEDSKEFILDDPEWSSLMEDFLDTLAQLTFLDIAGSGKGEKGFLTNRQVNWALENIARIKTIFKNPENKRFEDCKDKIYAEIEQLAQKTTLERLANLTAFRDDNADLQKEDFYIQQINKTKNN